MNAQILSALHQDTHSDKVLCIQITAHLKCLSLFKEGTCQFGQLEFGGSSDGENPQKLGTQKQKNHRIFYAHMTSKGNEGNKKQL